MSMSGAPVRRSAALGLALQALLVAAVLGGLFWVVQHALEVLRGRGVRSGFDFLAQSAGFEISEGWLRTWEKLSAPWNDGCNPLLLQPVSEAVAAHEALPGMAALVSAVAGRPLGPGRLLRDIGDDVRRALQATAVEVVG